MHLKANVIIYIYTFINTYIIVLNENILKNHVEGLVLKVK